MPLTPSKNALDYRHGVFAASQSASASSSLLASPSQWTGQLASHKAAFKSQQSKLDDLDDPLSIYDSYTQCLQAFLATPAASTSATGKQATSELIALLDEATRMFVTDPRYRNDPRYLRLWLAYSKCCRDAEEIFMFLEAQGIAQDLATFYEEWALSLERKAATLIGQHGTAETVARADFIYRSGIDKKAQPLERLKKKYSEFQARVRSMGISVPLLQGKEAASSLHRSNSNSNASLPSAAVSGTRAMEARGYDANLIQGGDLSFEEVRAQHWYAKPKIAKPIAPGVRASPLRSHQPLKSMENVGRVAGEALGGSIDDDFSGNVPTLGVVVNADDLTHINVFKDNTADLREIAHLVKANNAAKGPIQTGSHLHLQKKTPVKTAMTADWLLKEIIMSPPAKKQRSQAQDENSRPSSAQGFNPADFKIGSVQVASRESPLEGALMLLDPFDAGFRAAQTEAVLAEIAASIPNVYLRLNEPAEAKIRAFEKNLGRDGSGPNHTVSSLRIASGHFFMERRLGAQEAANGRVYLAVDLMADDEQLMMSDDPVGSGVNQVAIRLETPGSVWEAYILFRMHSFLEPLLQASPACFALHRHFPRLLGASLYADASFLVMGYYEQGSLRDAVNIYCQQSLPIDEVLVLYYAAELLKIVGLVHKAGLIHTDIRLEKLLLYSANDKHSAGAASWSSAFRRDGSEGWAERGLVLVDFGHAIDLKLLKEEERSRFAIRPEHCAANASPRVQRGLPVSHEMDWFGVADCLHWLLFQTRLTPLEGPSNTYTLSSPLKRYWLVDIWEPLFTDLLNPPHPGDLASQLSCFRGHMESIWQRLETWKRAPSLKSLLTRQEIMLYEHLPRPNK